MDTPRFASTRRASRYQQLGQHVAVVFVCLTFATSCQDSQAPQPAPSTSQDGAFDGAYDPANGVLAFELQSPDGSPNALRLVASNLRYDESTQELTAEVVVHNPGANPAQGPPIVLLQDFDPTTVAPRNAEGLACPTDGPPFASCWPWAYDYSGKFGPDGILDPGESSAPIEWILFDPDQASFSFQAALRVGEAPAAGIIAGQVFGDWEGAGRGFAGIPGMTVHLHHGDASTSTVTDEGGHFTFPVSEPGLYEVVREPSTDCDPTTPLRRQVLIVQRTDGSLSGYDRADFGCRVARVTPIQVRGRVFDDLDRDGERDWNEPGIPGVPVTVAGNLCPNLFTRTTITRANGFFSFLIQACAPPYVFTRTEIPGYQGTTPNPVVHSVGADELVVDFGVVAVDGDPAMRIQITGWVYRDENRSGTREQHEIGIPNAPVGVGCVSCLAEYPVLHTDATGFYRFYADQLPFQTAWRVQTDDGLCTTSPRAVELPANGVHEVDFGIKECNVPPQITIRGVVWFDANRNGTRETNERAVEGAVVRLVSPCEVLMEAVTGPTGHYIFAPQSIPCQIEAAALARPEFAVHTTPNPHPIDTNRLPPRTMLNVDFGVLDSR